MNAQGTLVHDDPEVDPIVPHGRAIKELGCILEWGGDVSTFEHPVRGPLKVEVVRGCPEISKQDKRDTERHDTLKQNGLFAGLLRLAIDGQLDAIVVARTAGRGACFSMRLGRAIPDHAGLVPIPAWGYPNLSLETKKNVVHDDVLLFPIILLYVLAQMARDSQLRNAGATKKQELGKKRQVGVLLEQPAEPEEEPACASFWRTFEWVTMKRMMRVHAAIFYQGDFGGEARKPTMCGTNLEIDLPHPAVRGRHARGESRSGN